MNAQRDTSSQPNWLVRLFGIDPRSLALFRIIFGLVLIYDLATRAVDYRAMYTDQGVAPLATVAESHRGSWHWSLYMLNESTAYQATLYGLSVILALTLLIGYRSRWSAFLLWVLLVSLHVRTPYLVTGGDVLLVVMLFWGMFLPLGRRWSLDAMRRAYPQNDNAAVLSIASVALLLQICVMYFFTGLFKLNQPWMTGQALYAALSDDMIARPFGQSLTQFPGLLNSLSWGTLALELASPLMLFSPWRTIRFRSAAILGLGMLHIGIQLCMKVMIFSFAGMAALSLFVPASWWDGVVFRKVTARIDGWFGCFSHATGDAPSDTGDLAARVWLRRLGTVAGVCCLAYMITYNVIRLSCHSQWPYQLRSLHRPAEVLAMGQQWNMFDRPTLLNNRHVALARLTDETQIDILRGTPVFDRQIRPLYAAPYATERWMLLFRYLALPSNVSFRPGVAEYLRRGWDAEHSADQAVIDLELLLFPHPSVVDSGEANSPISLAFIDTRAEGRYYFGHRHGHWINRFGNRGKASEGQYVKGVEHGRWTYWYEDGRKEAEGVFRMGKMHGQWRFWYTDGRVSVGMYKDDQLISRESATERLK